MQFFKFEYNLLVFNFCINNQTINYKKKFNNTFLINILLNFYFKLKIKIITNNFQFIN